MGKSPKGVHRVDADRRYLSNRDRPRIFLPNFQQYWLHQITRPGTPSDAHSLSNLYPAGSIHNFIYTTYIHLLYKKKLGEKTREKVLLLLYLVV